MVQAAVDAKVPLFIWAGLPSFKKISNGKYIHVDHFEGKADVSAFGRSLRSDSFSFAVVQPSHYNSNILTFAQPAGTAADGKPAYVWSCPTDGVVATFDIADYGLWVQAAIEHPELHGDEDVAAAVEDLTVKQFAEILTRSESLAKSELPWLMTDSNAHVDCYVVDADTFRSYLPPHMAKDITEMFLAIGDFGCKFSWTPSSH